jgi:hypothetical protein
MLHVSVTPSSAAESRTRVRTGPQAAESPVVADPRPGIAGRRRDSDITRGRLTNLILTHIHGETPFLIG